MRHVFLPAAICASPPIGAAIDAMLLDAASAVFFDKDAMPLFAFAAAATFFSALPL